MFDPATGTVQNAQSEHKSCLSLERGFWKKCRLQHLPVRTRFGGPCGWWADPDNSTKAQVDIWKCHDPLNCATVAASCAALHIM